MPECQVKPLEFAADEELAPKAAPLQFQSASSEKGGRCLRTLEGEDDHVVYTGNNYEEDGASSLQSVFLGVYDPESSTLELTGPTRVINLHPRLKGYQSEAKSSAGVTYEENRRELTAVFGSKKRKRALQQESDNVIDPKHLLNRRALTEILEKQSLTADKFVHTEQDVDAFRSQLLPPFNASAATPQEVYPSDTLISPAEWESLKESGASFKSLVRIGGDTALESVVEEGQLSPFVAELLRGTNPDGTKKESKVNRELRYIAMISILLRFYALPSTVRTTETELASVLQAPLPVIARIVRDFTSNGSDASRTALRKSPLTQDKLLIYVIILAMTIRDYSVDLSSLSESLQIPASRVDLCAREMGASKKGTIFSLATPLTFPKRARGKAKRR